MEEERNYTVYMHICRQNNKAYVGITGQEIHKRWKGGSGYSNNDYFARAIKKYGWDGFDHIILFENKNKEDAEYLEILFIKILMSNEKEYGYNIANGGNCVGTMSDETKLKISIANKGKKRSKEVILKYKTAQKI